MSQLFVIPKDWSWKKLSETTQYVQRGKSPKYSDQDSEMIVINQKCIRWHSLNITYARNIATEQVSGWNEERILKKGDLLWNSTGTGTIGRACIFWEANTVKKYVVDSHVTIVRTDDKLLPEFLFYWIYSPFIQNNFDALQAGSTNQVELSRKAILETLIPIPPIDIQTKIIEKIHFLFSEINIGIEQLNRVKVKLASYKQSVLNAAIHGKLVYQDQNDEPASGLLGKAKYEKEILISMGKIKKQKKLLPINKDEISFNLPDGWDWVRLQDIAIIQGGIQKQPKRSPRNNSYPFLRVANVLKGNLNLVDIHQVELFEGELERFQLETGDLLIVEGNGSPNEIGRMAIWDGSIQNCVHQNHIIRARLTCNISPVFIESCWNSLYGREQLLKMAGSTSGLYTLSVSKISAFMLPLPPLREQQRIANRIVDLLDNQKLCFNHLNKIFMNGHILKQSILKKAFEGHIL